MERAPKIELVSILLPFGTPKLFCRPCVSDFVRDRSFFHTERQWQQVESSLHVALHLSRKTFHLELVDPPFKERALRSLQAPKPPHGIDHSVRQKLL